MSVKQALRNVITPEMDHSVIESSSFLWATRIIDIISTTTVGFLLCYHTYTIYTFSRYQASKSKRASRKSVTTISEALEGWTKALNICTISFIIPQFILLLLMTLNIWSLIPTSTSCDYMVVFMVTLYHLSKSLFYCILITRLQVAFYLSSLKYNDIAIMALYVFVIIYTVFVCAGTPFLIYGVWLTNPVTWCHIHTHDTLWSSISIAIWIIMDVVISIILCYLFIRPIKKVSKLTDQKQKRFTMIYVKYAILTYVSIILNLISLLLYLFDHLTILIEITAAINCICIVLMHIRYHSSFMILCGCLVKRCMKTQNIRSDTTGNKDEKVALSTKDKSEDDNIWDDDQGKCVDMNIVPTAMQIADESNDDDNDYYEGKETKDTYTSKDKSIDSMNANRGTPTPPNS